MNDLDNIVLYDLPKNELKFKYDTIVIDKKDDDHVKITFTNGIESVYVIQHRLNYQDLIQGKEHLVLDNTKKSGYRLMIGWVQYFATGEGMLNVYYAQIMDDEEEFKKNMAGQLNIDPYYMSAFQFVELRDVPEKYHSDIERMNGAGAAYWGVKTYYNYS